MQVRRDGVMKWLPLPKIAHGIVIYPFSPTPNLNAQSNATGQTSATSLHTPTSSRPNTAYSTIQSPLLSPLNDESSMLSANSVPTSPVPEPIKPSDLNALIPLEVGDEVFLIEQQKSWYRGYVLRALNHGEFPNTAPIGCFPKNHVHIKGYVRVDAGKPEKDRMEVAIDSMDPNTIPDVEPISSPDNSASMLSYMAGRPPKLPRSLSESNITKVRSISQTTDETTKESEEKTSRPGSTTGIPFSSVSSTLSSLDLAETHHQPHSQQRKQPPRLPPLPFTRYSQCTATGESEPLIDEIAACIREWNCLLYKHLTERRYAAFNSLKDQINYLFQARRQLLDQTLSREELSRLRKELIHRMVVINVIQGGEMVLRHPNIGHLLDLHNTSIATIYRMHFEYANKELNTPGTQITSNSLTTSLLSSPATIKLPSPSIAALLPNSTSGLAELTENMQPASPSVIHPPSPLILNSPNSTAKGAKFYHLYFDLKACVAHICQPGEYTELYFSLYNRLDEKFLTEEFLVVMNYNGMPKDESRIGKLNTLFTQISNHDLNKDIYLICRIVRMGSMKMSDKDHVSSLSGGQASIISGGADAKSYFDVANGKEHQISLQHQLAQQRQMSQPTAPQSNNVQHGLRRPFGCAVLHLGGLLKGTSSNQTLGPPTSASAYASSPGVHQTPGSVPSSSAGGTPGLNIRSNLGTSSGRDMLAAEHFMPIYTPTTESGYSSLINNIIDETTKEYERNPRAEMLCVYLRLFHGELDNVVKTNTGLLQDVPITSWIGFPDVVFPGDERNELYITLSSGDFAQMGRSKNVQVTVCVRNNVTGDVIEDALHPGIGVGPTTYWESMIFYHDQRPSWEETIKVKIDDVDKWKKSHVYLTVRHRSSSGYSSQPTQGHSSLYRSQSNSIQGLASEKIVAFGFLPLFLPPLFQNFVVDGTHNLALYRYDKQFSNSSSYLSNFPWCLQSTAPTNTASNNQNSANKQNHRLTFKHGSQGSIGSRSALAIIPNGSNGSLSRQETNQSANVNTAAPIGMSVSLASSSVSKPVLLRDTVTFRTFLCSTQYTQNQILVQLLNWQTFFDRGAEGQHELQSVLDQFTFVGEMEVVKFLSDIFDALFGILTTNHMKRQDAQEVDDLVVEGIVWVLGIIQDRRFSNFRPVLDVYIEQLFAQSSPQTPGITFGKSPPKEAYVYDALLKSHLRLCSDPADVVHAKKLRSSMKVWEYLFRFIVRSREAARHTEEESERMLRDMMFKEELQQLMKMINGIMNPDLPSSMIGSQTLALQHFAGILGELRRVFSPSEVAGIITNFLDASAHVTGKLVAYRLCTIISIIKSPIFMDMDSKNALVPKVVEWIEGWLRPYSQVANEQGSNSGKDSNVSPSQASQTISHAQWLENLRLTITIVYLITEKVRGYRSMSHTSTSLSSSWVSSMFSLKSISNIRPISLATHDEYDESHEDHVMATENEVAEVTVILLSLLPLLLSTYTELQQIVSQCYKAMLQPNPSASSTTSSTVTSSYPSAKSPGSSSRNSISLRDRAGSVSSKAHSVNAHNSSTQPTNSNSLSNQSILSKSPATPFPSVYPFPSTTTVKATVKSSTVDVTPLISSGLSDISVIILELFNVVPSHEWKQYLINAIEVHGSRQASMMIREVCGVCLGILQGEMIKGNLDDDGIPNIESSAYKKIAAARAIPRNWLNLQMVAHQVIINSVLIPIIELIAEGYFPLEPKADPQFELEVNNSPMALWECVLRTIFTVVSSRELEIGRFLPQRQHAMWKLVGDLRGGTGMQALLSLWKAYRLDQLLPDMEDENEEAENLVDDDELETSSEPDKIVETPSAINTLTSRASVASVEQLQHKPSPLSIVTTAPLPSKLTIFHARTIPLIIMPLCTMCLANHDYVRQVAAGMMIDLLIIEYKRTSNVMRLQQYLIGTMDHLLMVEKTGSPDLRRSLIIELKNSLEKHVPSISTECYELCTSAITSLVTFMDLLLQIRSLPQDSDEYMDERINGTLKLMRFIQMIEREEIYIKYVHQLVHLQLESNNFIEAALTLRLHADLFEWDPYSELPAISELNFPMQTAFARKEKIYLKMLDYLERGKAWEICVDLCKELAHQYEATTFDYIRLSEVLSRQAGYIESIARKERYYPEYFRVGYYGRGFPASVRNHQVVFRGLEWEKIGSFIERIQNKHPNAEVLPSKLASGGSISDKELKELEESPDGQYLQITAVTPEPVREDRPIFNNELVTDNIRTYYMANEVSRFSFSKPILKPTVNSDDGSSNKPENDFLNLWTEKTTLICEDSFPTILRRTRVIKTIVVELSPIENAVHAMEQKNAELAALERKYAHYIPKVSKGQQQPSTNTNNINPFSMALNGAVDAPVNGGVPMYKMAFLSGSFAKQNPDMLDWVERLRDTIDNQVEILERCLEVHNKIVPAEMRPLHNNLVKFFHKNFKEEIQRINLKRNMSQAASRASRNSKVLSATSLQEIIDKTPASRQGSISPGLASGAGAGSGNQKHGAMPPISRAFSIRPSSMILTDMDDNMQVTEEDLLNAGKKTAPSDVSSKAESLSRSFKMSLRMKAGRRRTSSNPDMFADVVLNPPAQRTSTKSSIKTTSSSSPSLLTNTTSTSKSSKKRTWAFPKPR
ncbi:hypothetical protein BGW37DRAFT_121469 [Umbelopsis sp. PMI_123]|nr:hypothetical protein BGW37DRAFT_121469 [Umbelopsis sp. PMI_123]